MDTVDALKLAVLAGMLAILTGLCILVFKPFSRPMSIQECETRGGVLLKRSDGGVACIDRRVVL